MLLEASIWLQRDRRALCGPSGRGHDPCISAWVVRRRCGTAGVTPMTAFTEDGDSRPCCGEALAEDRGAIRHGHHDGDAGRSLLSRKGVDDRISRGRSGRHRSAQFQPGQDISICRPDSDGSSWSRSNGLTFSCRRCSMCRRRESRMSRPSSWATARLRDAAADAVRGSGYRPQCVLCGTSGGCGGLA